MPTFTFQDIFKSSFLERLDAVSLPDAAIALALAFCLGLFIFLVYKKCYAGVMYAPSFGVTLIALTLITTLLILAVTSNIVLSLGMVGALSIVRFRTAIKEPMDIAFLFWAIAAGIVLAAGLIPLAVVGSLFVGVVLLVFSRQKNGESPYILVVHCADQDVEGQVRALVEENLSLPLAALNALRREALEKLSVQRQEPPRRRTGEYHAGARYENRREEPVLTISVRRAEQLTDELLRLRPALVYVPLDELAAHPEKAAGTEHTSIGVSLPRVAWDREYPGLREKLEQVRALGVKDALLGNLGMFPIARELGFTLRGDFGLEIYNAQALKEYKRLGLQSATLSFELKLAQIRDLSKCLDTELITYGRLPLMLMENCIIRNRTGSCGCQNTNILTDRKGARFPVVSAPGCRNELLNSQKLFLADRAADYRRIGLWAQRLLFTTENPRECVQVAQRYLEQGSWTPNEYTRGLYYRDVE